MRVRTARLTDLPRIRRLASLDTARVLSPSAFSRRRSPLALAFASAWQAFGHRVQTLVLAGGAGAAGFATACARPGRESWDIVHLASVAHDPELAEQAAVELLDRMCVATAQRGALRTFVRLPLESGCLDMVAGRGFRPFATEIAWCGTLAALIDAAPEPAVDVRQRASRDAWDIFSLYCAITPALVRHAEGRSLREWASSARDRRMLARMCAPREVVCGEQGDVQIWLRWTPTRGRGAQAVDLLVRPEAADRLGEVMRFAVEHLDLDPHAPTWCKAREYDGRVSATLERAGFSETQRDMLLVRHTAARVTERQLLLAALRAQGLGIDVSQYGHRRDPAQQRLASSREAERYNYDRFVRARDNR